MKRLLLALPLLAVAVACHPDSGSAPQATNGGGRALSAPPPAPDVTLVAGPDARHLAVVAARPQGELQGLNRPTLTFSKPVVSLSTLEQDGAAGTGPGPAVKFVIEPRAAGQWRWLGSSSVEFVPAAQLPYSTGFTVSVPAGLAALDGSKLQAPYSFRFTTPVPEVQQYLGVPGAAACRFSEPEQVFQVFLNQPLEGAEAHFSFESDGRVVGARLLRAVNVQDERRAEEEKAAANPTPGSPVKPRRFARASPGDLGFKSQQTRYELRPQSPLPKGQPFTLRLDAAAHGAQGPLPMRGAFKLSCAVYGPMRVTGVQRCWEGSERCSSGPVWLGFTNPLGSIAELKKRLKITPAVTLDWDEQSGDEDLGVELLDQRTRVRIPARWRPGTTYAIGVDAGVKDRVGQEAEAAASAVTLDDLRPSIYLGRELALLEAAGDGMLPAQVTNLSELSVEAWALSPPQYLALRYCQYRTDCSHYPQSPADSAQKLPLAFPKNEPRLYGIDVRGALKGARSGLLALRIDAKDRAAGEKPLRVLAQLTDVIVHAKIGVAGGVAWVTSARTGAPLEGASVVVYSLQGPPGAGIATGPDGLANLPPNQQLDPHPVDRSWEQPRLLVAATWGGDTGVVTTAFDDTLTGQDVSPSFDVLNERALGQVFTDRGLYRPGDTVHAKALMRRFTPATASGLTTPKGEVKFVVKAPEGRVLLEKVVPISAYGAAGIDLVLPKEGKLGGHDISVYLVSDPKQVWFGGFTVAEYRAPQFRVDVLAAAPDLLAGSRLGATVSARYLFGGAMTGAAATWSVIRSSAEFSPPGHDAFSFGRQTSNQDEGEPGLDSGLFASGKGTIDAKGNLTIDPGPTDAPGGRPARYLIEAEVQDVSRQTVAGRQRVLVHPAEFYLGLGKQSLFSDAGKPFSLPVLAASPAGANVAGVAVKVTALVRSWHAVRKKGVGGVYQSITEPVDEAKAACEIKTGEGAVPCTMTLEQAGFYTLRAEAKDAAGRLALSTVGVYVLGKGFAAWQRGDTPRVEMVPDKSEYRVGEVAHVLIKSPYPECQALISVEREGVQERRVQTLTGTAVAIDIPITEAMVPNVFVGAVLQRARVEQGGVEPGDDPGRPSVRAGYAELSVGRAIKRLAVAIGVPKTEWRPREKVPVTLSVKDQAGAPRQAEIVVYAVDEAVLQLTAYQVPDLINEMFPHRPLGVALGEPLLTLVRRQRFGEKGELQPGGGGGRGPGGDARSRFVTTALWTTVETGPDGTARTELELPDNLTTFRIMAVALTSGDRFGSAETQVRVSLPLLVLPALPRFARTGDQFEAGVVVNAKGLAAQQSEVKVSAELSGAVALAPGQPAEQTVTAVEGVAREVRFKVAATGSGPAKLIFRASAEGDFGKGGPVTKYTDAVEQTIPVQLPIALEAVAVYGETADKATEGLIAPAGVRPGVGGLTLTLSSSALGGLGEGMRQLIDYPYGCLEQLSSRLIPFVALREVQKVFAAPQAKGGAAAAGGPANPQLRQLTGREDGEQSTDADTVVRQTVARIEELQAPSGGFRYWPGEGCTYAWPSIYATLALHRAREAGYPVQKATLETAKKFLARKAEGQAGCQNELVGPETRAFALQVLARMGDPRPAFTDELYELKDRLPLFGKALLADAIVLGKGKGPKAQQLLQEILDQAQETPGEVHFAEVNGDTYAPLLSSDVRTTGMVLQTLVDLQPTHPYVGKIARYFHSARHGGAFRNTQEAAYALMGLTEVVRVRERTAPDFTARVALGGKELASERFAGRSLAVITKKIAMDTVIAAAKAGGKTGAPFSFSVEGTGLLTYGALLRYAPAELPAKARDEGMFVQRWFEPYDQPGKLATAFGAGELVRVRVRVATRMERHFVAVDVPLPAGLEAVDTQLATSAQKARAADEEQPEGGAASGEEGFDDRGQGGYGFWSPFNYSEKRDDRVVYFADDLPPGVHVQSFVARATTPGRFLLKPAHAEEMYTPEVFGRSEGGMLEVTAQQPLTQK